MVFLATDIRPPTRIGPDAIIRLAAETGAAGIHVGGGCDLETLDPLVRSAARVGLEVPSMALPLAERPLGAGRRQPRLAALERDERAAAIALAESGLAAGMAGGGRLFALDFGPVHLVARVGELARAFARREMGEDEAGADVLAAAMAERRARGTEIADACGFALERLVRAGEKLGATFLLPVGASPWEAPSPREAGDLLAAFAGAPVRAVWNPARLSMLCALGLPISEERLRDLAAGSALVIENDAVGLSSGYLFGTGERDPRLAAHNPPSSIPRVLLGPPSTTHEDVATAISRL